jgi:hypothetical protein
MATAYTSLLGFALPVTGELPGTWGDVVNASVTQLVEDSVAGTATQDVTAADWTLTTSGSGAANQARMAILIPTGTPGVARNIIAPQSSKAYILDNQTDANVVLKGATTTGVTVVSGKQALIAWDGADFVQVGASAGGSNTQVQYNDNGALAGSASFTFDGTTLTAPNLKDSGLTASKPVFTDASKNLVSTGTLGVDQGGTGSTTLTLNNLLVGNGASALQTIAPGTAGNVLVSNGTSWTSSVAPNTFTNVSVISGSTAAVNKTLYVFTSSLTLTLPATPTAGDYIGVSNESGTLTSVISRNGSNIMGLAENMTVDALDAGFTLVYSGASKGWVIL